MANLSQQKRERMLAFLDRIREEHKMDENTLIAINEIENELTRKKYGLVWEEHTENVDIRMETNVPVFAEDGAKEIAAAPGEEFNFLLEGDNLHSLKLLEKTHEGRIGVIYIDPPYNTGNKEFIYDDKMIGEDDGYRHSKWISFMKNRLNIAWNLLCDHGVIFISIDDREQANLKLLCDELFGERCFMSTFVWQKRYSPDVRRVISDAHEYILCYSKDPTVFKEFRNLIPLGEAQTKQFSNPDNDPRGPWKSDNFTAPGWRPNQMYEITLPSGRVVTPPEGRCWRVTKEGFEKFKAEGKMIYGRDGDGAPAVKRFLSEMPGMIPWTWLPQEEVGHTQEGNRQLRTILGKQLFDYPKPVRLIKRFLQIASQRDSIVLDFFAGSGTTAQAVLELNKEDGGNRRFILCTNNENGICENVTYPRVKTVITGIRPDGSEYSDGIPANLKYYRTDFVPKSAYEMQEDLLGHMKEMVQIEHGIDLDDRRYVIIMDDDAADELEENWDEYPDLKGIYISSDVLLTAEQQTLFESVDLNIIPEYYFEAELREAGQAL